MEPCDGDASSLKGGIQMRIWPEFGRKAEIVTLAGLHLVCGGLMATIVDFHVPSNGLGIVEWLHVLFVPGFSTPLYLYLGVAGGGTIGWLVPIAHSLLWALAASAIWQLSSATVPSAAGKIGSTRRAIGQTLPVDRWAVLGAISALTLCGCCAAYVLAGKHFGGLLVGFYMWPDMVDECGLVQGTEAWWDGGPSYDAWDCDDHAEYTATIEGLCNEAGRD